MLEVVDVEVGGADQSQQEVAGRVKKRKMMRHFEAKAFATRHSAF